ncbi:hypothetical protein QFC24_002250 [Naganishia onofrii]|uniref:Uncharacterized protein n=1 Tax=Naganishia onofrii TaxID=1851511 RepID=A0ACC2XPP3_9TREE|nr:hypothetical protein QFC24_002250 [Naganishia onofrii]
MQPQVDGSDWSIYGYEPPATTTPSSATSGTTAPANSATTGTSSVVRFLPSIYTVSDTVTHHVSVPSANSKLPTLEIQWDASGGTRHAGPQRGPSVYESQASLTGSGAASAHTVAPEQNLPSMPPPSNSSMMSLPSGPGNTARNTGRSRAPPTRRPLPRGGRGTPLSDPPPPPPGSVPSSMDLDVFTVTSHRDFSVITPHQPAATEPAYQFTGGDYDAEPMNVSGDSGGPSYLTGPDNSGQPPETSEIGCMDESGEHSSDEEGNQQPVRRRSSSSGGIEPGGVIPEFGHPVYQGESWLIHASRHHPLARLVDPATVPDPDPDLTNPEERRRLAADHARMAEALEELDR